MENTKALIYSPLPHWKTSLCHPQTRPIIPRTGCMYCDSTLFGKDILSIEPIALRKKSFKPALSLI